MKFKLLYLSFLLMVSFDGYSQKEIDSLLQIIQNTQDTTLKVDAINTVSFLLRVIDPDSSIVLSLESERLSKLIDYPIGIANSKMRRGISYSSLGNYYLALQLFLDSKATYEELGNRNKMASCLNNMGRVYNFIEDYDNSLKYYKQSAILFSELKDKFKEGNILNNIGHIYKIQGDYEKAIEYLNRSQSLARIVNSVKNEAYPIYNIGSVYMLNNQFDSASKYLNKSLILSEQQRNKYLLSLTYSDIGQMQLKKKQIHKAEYSMIKAFEIAKQTGLRLEQKEAARHLSMIYEKKKDLTSALQYHKLYKALDDSLFNRGLARKMAFQEAEYDFNRKREIDELQNNKAKLEQEKTLTKALWIRNSLIAGLAAMALIFFLLYMNFSRKRMANLALKKLNMQIELQAEELIKVNREIIAMNDNLEIIVNRRTEQLKIRNQQLKEYLSSNSHIVRAPLARILGLVDLYDSKDDENLDFIIDNLNDSALELDSALRDINEKLSKENI